MRGLIVKSFEHEKSDFVGNAFSDQQPMEFLEGRCYVFMSFSASAYVVNFLVELHIWYCKHLILLNMTSLKVGSNAEMCVVELPFKLYCAVNVCS